MVLEASEVLRVRASSLAVTPKNWAARARTRSRKGPNLARFWKLGSASKSRRKCWWRSRTGKEAGQTLAALR